MKIRLLLLSFFIGLYGFTQTTYTSISSGDWDDPNIWQNSIIPTTDGNVILNNDIIINSSSSVDTIEINPGASLTVNSTANLTFNSLNLNSNSTSYSNLIADGTVTGTVNYNRHINFAPGSGSTTSSNDLISPPLSGMTFGDLRATNSNILSGTIGGNGPFYLFGPFDNSSVNNYVLFEETVDDGIILEPGIGYRTGSTDGGTYTFTGNVETGTISKPITTPTGGGIFNLIGNPYPSYISLSEFLNINSNQFDPSGTAVYGYDGESENGWTIWNDLYLLLNPNTVIAPGQGFFVVSKSAGGTVNFNPNMRSIGNTDDFIANRPSSAITNIKLNLSSASDEYNTDIYFTALSTLGLDQGYDARVFSNDPSLLIYSHLVQQNTGISFAIQALGKIDYGDTLVALGVKANQGEQITFSLAENTLPTTTEVFLDDTVDNTSTLLTNADYTITPTTNINGVGRFYLRFFDSSLSISENTLDGLNIYNNQSDKTIVIAGELLDTTTVKIYDIQGRIVNTSVLQKRSSQTIDVSGLTTGVYVVQLLNKTQSKTQKIIIN